jgi:hypothetical protein
MKNYKNLKCIIGALCAFAATVAAIIVFWDEIYDFVTSVREKIIRMLDSISQRTYIDHYDEYDDYTDYIEEE